MSDYVSYCIIIAYKYCIYRASYKSAGSLPKLCGPERGRWREQTSHMYEHIGYRPCAAPGELIQVMSPSRFSWCCPEFFTCETCEKCWLSFTFFFFPCVPQSHVPQRVSRASARKPKCWGSSNIFGRTLAPRA